MMEASSQHKQEIVNALQLQLNIADPKSRKSANTDLNLLNSNEVKPLIMPKKLNMSAKTETNSQRDENKCDTDTKEASQRSPTPVEAFQRSGKLTQSEAAPSTLCVTTSSKPNSPNFRRENSTRSLKSYYIGGDSNYGRISNEFGSHFSKPHSDAASVRSWASVGMGSTDGKKMIVRRVPTSPVELFNIVNPPTPPEEYLYDGESDNNSEGDEDSVYVKPRRQHWSNKLQFVLACVGYSVGIGSVWRFPYLCYKSGGGVFLIPYFIMMVFCGVPMLYMELAVGQFTGRGPIGALGHLCPLLKGTGLGSVVISFLMSTYYSVIIAYGIYYFFTSFKAKQPWEDCSHRWNNEHCWAGKFTENVSKPNDSQTPAEQFYDKKVLQIGKGIEDFDNLRWELVACLVCAWILVYFAIWKSIKSSAKVRYFTATLPFLLIIVFLAKSLTLEGADKGMRYFFRPRFELLLEAKVWVNAAAQTFNSMGIAFGSMISFASYSKYNNNILHDTLAVSCVNAITSLLVGIFAFATIGNIATEQETTIEDVIDDGPGLIFVVYPQAMAKMPAAQLWAVLFFFMLICLALNSQFAIVEVVVTSIQDGFPIWIKRNLMCHEILVLVICVVSLLCGLPNVTQGGIYFFQLIDHYAASISIMYLAFFEVVSVAWFYGVGRLSRNVKTMTGRHPSLFFKICWLILTPLLIFSVWVFCMIDYESPTYNNGDYHYPLWAIVLGWIISALSILCIPICMVYVFIQSPGETLLEKLKNSLKPDFFDKCPKCEEFECSCEFKDEMEPMLILKPELNSNNLTPVPFYTPLNREQTIHKMTHERMPDARRVTANNIQKPPESASAATEFGAKVTRSSAEPNNIGTSSPEKNDFLTITNTLSSNESNIKASNPQLQASKTENASTANLDIDKDGDSSESETPPNLSGKPGISATTDDQGQGDPPMSRISREYSSHLDVQLTPVTTRAKDATVDMQNRTNTL